MRLARRCSGIWSVVACSRHCGNGSARSWCINAARFIRAGTSIGTWPSRIGLRRIGGSGWPWSKRATPMPGAMLRELEAWLRTKNESAAESLREAFEVLLTLHRLQVPALLRKTLLPLRHFATVPSSPLARNSSTCLMAQPTRSGVTSVTPCADELPPLHSRQTTRWHRQ